MDVVYSKQPVHLAVGDGTTRFFNTGEAVDSKDPIVKAFPGCFTKEAAEFLRRAPISQTAEETATAGPGERRTRRAR